MAKRSETKNEFFEDLRAGLTAAIDHAQGKRMDLRTTTRSLPRPPREMSSKEITGIRTRLNVSQGVFARALNISPKTVQSWEQGIGRPNGASLKLLSIAERDPSILFDEPPPRETDTTRGVNILRHEPRPIARSSQGRSHESREAGRALSRSATQNAARSTYKVSRTDGSKTKHVQDRVGGRSKS